MGSVFQEASGRRRDAGEVTPGQWRAVSRELVRLLATTDRDTFGELNALDDPWGAPLRYRPAAHYPLRSGAIDIDAPTPPRAGSYQLWSCGPDRGDDQGRPDSDDRTNWRR